MADTPITVSAAGVVKGSGAQTEAGTAGETITAGQVVYKKASDSKFYKCDCDATAHTSNGEVDNIYGIALNGAAASQPLTVQKSGEITMTGTTLVVGTVYVLSETAGSFQDVANLPSTSYVVIVGVGLTVTSMHLLPYTTGVAKP